MAGNSEKVKFISPFSLRVDPMERLLLVNFEKDPDLIYKGFEPQVFKNDGNGESHVILGWRRDGKVDVYHQPDLLPDPSTYDIAGKGLATIVPVSIERASCHITEYGVQAHYKFSDLENRDIEIIIKEGNPIKRRPFGLLAPMGDAAENPSSMPLVLLRDFYFVRKKHSYLHISIDKKIHKADELPLPMDWSRMYFTRYSSKPLIATFNPACKGALPTMYVPKGKEIFQFGEYVYHLRWEDGFPQIKTIIRSTDKGPVKILFKPAFPSPEILKAGTEKKGAFSILSHSSIGKLIGKYRVKKGPKNILIILIPGRWKPRITKFSLWILYTVGAVFKKWPSTYKWEANLEKQPGSTKDLHSSTWHMSSHWVRTGKILGSKN